MRRVIRRGESEVSRKKKGRSAREAAAEGVMPVSIGEALGIPNHAGAENARPAKNSAEQKPDLGEFLRRTSQITMHRESSGRGGHTVTAAAFKPEPEGAVLEATARAIRKGLGCGSHVEGSRVILHGDVMDRAASWFAKNGARRIVRGN
jgi:translation initiation factor 1 (eIF-1/SUI1)